MGSYNEEYREYYSKLRNEINSNKDKGIFVQNKGKENAMDLIEDISDIHQSNRDSNHESYNGRYRGSYYSNYYVPTRDSNYDNKKITKKHYGKYIHRLIIRLTITGILFCGVFLLKVVPYEQAKELYVSCKTIIKTDFDYRSFLLTLESFGESIKNSLEDKINVFYQQEEKEDINSFKQKDIKENADNI